VGADAVECVAGKLCALLGIRLDVSFLLLAELLGVDLDEGERSLSYVVYISPKHPKGSHSQYPHEHDCD